MIYIIVYNIMYVIVYYITDKVAVFALPFAQSRGAPYFQTNTFIVIIMICIYIYIYIYV